MPTKLDCSDALAANVWKLGKPAETPNEASAGTVSDGSSSCATALVAAPATRTARRAITAKRRKDGGGAGSRGVAATCRVGRLISVDGTARSRPVRRSVPLGGVRATMRTSSRRRRGAASAARGADPADQGGACEVVDDQVAAARSAVPRGGHASRVQERARVRRQVEPRLLATRRDGSPAVLVQDEP